MFLYKALPRYWGVSLLSISLDYISLNKTIISDREKEENKHMHGVIQSFKEESCAVRW